MEISLLGYYLNAFIMIIKVIIIIPTNLVKARK